jgi:hypothetical protein
LVDLVLSGDTLREGRLAVVHLGGNVGETLTDGGVRVLLEVATSLNRGSVLLEFRLDGFRVLEGLGDDGDFDNLFGGEREPILLLGLEAGLVGEGDGSVEEGRRSSDDNTVSTESVDYLLGDFDRGGNVVLPDVTSRDETEGESDLGVLDGRDDLVELLGGTVEVDVKSVDGELGNELDVRVETSEVGSEGDLETGGSLGEGLEGRLVLVAELSGRVHYERGLIDLNLGSTGFLKLLEEFSVDGDELVEGLDGFEGRGSLVTAGLSEEKGGDGTDEDGTGDDTSLLSLEELVDGLGVVELELGRRRNLRLDVVAVNVRDKSVLGIGDPK